LPATSTVTVPDLVVGAPEVAVLDVAAPATGEAVELGEATVTNGCDGAGGAGAAALLPPERSTAQTVTASAAATSPTTRNAGP
jgi:hypothetical protein